MNTFLESTLCSLTAGTPSNRKFRTALRWPIENSLDPDDTRPYAAAAWIKQGRKVSTEHDMRENIRKGRKLSGSEQVWRGCLPVIACWKLIIQTPVAGINSADKEGC